MEWCEVVVEEWTFLKCMLALRGIHGLSVYHNGMDIQAVCRIP